MLGRRKLEAEHLFSSRAMTMGTGCYNIIPEGESHCVWMDAGFINYKLCDSNFDCDSCPFDWVAKNRQQALAGRPTAPSGRLAAPDESAETILDQMMVQWLKPLKDAALPNDRLYFRNHLWLQRMNDGQCKVGIDGCLALLLNPLTGAVVINTPVRIQKDSPFAWLIRDHETFSLHSSMAGVVTATNTAVAARPSTLTADPYDQGWLMMLTPRDGEGDCAGAYCADAFHRHLQNDIARLESLLNSRRGKLRREIGASRFDGGVRVETIEQFLGKQCYLRLLLTLLRPHVR
jgi:glycine cleavage system H protein